MEINLEIKRLKEIVEQFEKTPKEMKRELRIALKKALQSIQRRARLEHNFRSKTGTIERSIMTEVISSDEMIGRVFIDQNVAPHGVYIHEGTGIYGSKHDYIKIFPKNKKCLRWVAGGGGFILDFVFAKKVLFNPGVKPDPFIYKAAEFKKNDINKIFDRHIDKALGKLSSVEGTI